MPRAGLSRAAVVDLAVALVDDEGLDALTLAAVAGRAGVAVPSLYKHIGSLGALRSALALVGVRELGRRTSAATVGLAGEDAVRALGRAIRSYAHEHPGLYASTQGVLDPADSELAAAAADTVAVVGGVLRGFELASDREVDAIRAARSAIHGFVALEAGGGFGLPDDVDRSFEALLDLLVHGLRALARP